MGRPHVTRAVRARLGCGVGIFATALGVLFVAGLGWALIAAGIQTAVYWLLVYDVDEPEQHSVKPRKVVR